MDDQELEAFLKQFRPRRPAPLPGRVSSQPRNVRWWLTTAAVIALCAIGLRTRRSISPPQPAALRVETTAVRERDGARAATLWKLSQVMREDADRLDTALTEVSGDLLPPIDQPDHALYPLAKP